MAGWAVKEGGAKERRRWLGEDELSVGACRQYKAWRCASESSSHTASPPPCYGIPQTSRALKPAPCQEWAWPADKTRIPLAATRGGKLTGHETRRVNEMENNHDIQIKLRRDHSTCNVHSYLQAINTLSSLKTSTCICDSTRTPRRDCSSLINVVVSEFVRVDGASLSHVFSLQMLT